MTRLKLALVNVVIILGALVIAYLQWPHARADIGNADDIGGMILLEILIAGIPIVLWAAAAHYGLTWLIMRRGELDEYRAQQEIARLPSAPEPLEHRPNDLLE